MNYISIIKILIFSAFLPTLTTLISGGRINYNLILIFIGYFLLSIYCIKNYREEIPIWLILFALFAGRCLLSLKVIYNYFEGEIWSLPYFILSLLGMICGLLYFYLKSPFSILPFLLGLLFTAFMFFQGWNYWIHYYNFGTFSGKVKSYNLPAKFEAIDEEKNLVTDSNFQNKIILLDFWTTTCGICFQKFPQVQSAYEKYKSDASVMILAVNTPIEEDKPNQAFNDIRKEGHNFPVVITKDEDLAEKWGVRGYPTTFVLNPNGQIVYKGDIEGAVKMVDELKSTLR